MNVSPLLASAQEFLIESLDNWKSDKLGFAIVHAITATELALKERLTRLNPALILSNIDTKAPGQERTVSLSALPRRLANLGIPLAAEDAQLIRDIAEWRHQIVHHAPAFDHALAKRQLPQLLDFLAGFFRKNLQTPIETFLPEGLFKIAESLLADWRVAADAARDVARQAGRVLGESCPRCGGSAVLSFRADDDVHCHLCGASLYLCECANCRRKTVLSESPCFWSEYCSDCIEAAADLYVQQQIDLARGK